MLINNFAESLFIRDDTWEISINLGYSFTIIKMEMID